jgi:putative membrane protein
MVVKLIQVIVGATAVLTAVSAAAELPIPSQPAATQNAQAYLFHGGAGDIFEISTSMAAVQHSQNTNVRAFATMLIGDHTNLTNTALATAKGAGVMAPPPVLSPAQMGMITQLMAAGPANFDRVYLQQQVTAHQMALAMQQAYAARGDTPALRQAAASAVPVIQGHLAKARQLLAAAR